MTERIIIWDEYGGCWDITSENVLWPEVQKQLDAGVQNVILPLATIRQNLGWGWWTALEAQRAWLEGCGVPAPTLDTLSLQNDAVSLSEALSRFGGYTTYLSAKIGELEGQYKAYQEGYSVAVMVGTKDLPEKLAEKAKEAKVVAASETLRETKRRQIETEAIILAAKGLRDAYQNAWDTTSRLITLFAAEAGLTSSRHP
jgi:hypothetical protein